MKMFVQNVVTDDDDEDAMPLPINDLSANADGDDEEAALPIPTIHFSVNRGKPTGRQGSSRVPGVGETNLNVSECPECGFRFTSEGDTPEPVYRDYPKTRQGPHEAEITCPRCGETIE